MTTPFETTARKLEQFFFMHNIHHSGFYKNQDGLTVWIYLLDEEGMRVLEEYREIVKKRKKERDKKEK